MRSHPSRGSLLSCFAPASRLALPRRRSNPLAPLTAAEIRGRRRRFSEIRARLSGRYPFQPDRSGRTAQGSGAARCRRAAAGLRRHLRPRGNKTFEAVANLSSGSVASWKEIPGAQPPVGEQDSTLADRIVRADPRWREGHARSRHSRPQQRVLTVAWPAGYFALPGDDDRPDRARSLLTIAGPRRTIYAHPVEGVVAHVNLTTRQDRRFRWISTGTRPFRARTPICIRALPALPPGARAPADHPAERAGLPDRGRRGAMAEVALPLRAASARRAGALHRRV